MYKILLFTLLYYESKSSIITKSWNKAVLQTMYEQEVEDENSIHKMDNHLVRRLIVMPLTEAFNPSQISAMHSKVQYGDKCSLPGSIGKIIFEKPYEVPWIFEIKPVKQYTPSIKQSEIQTEKKFLEKAYISPLDFRSPENYIFLPQWLMNSMGLNSNDIVDVSFIRLKSASLVVLQPLTEEWDKLMLHTKNPRSVLEHEVNKYSSLTAGAKILIEFEGIEYPLMVKQTIAEGGIAVRGVRIQDADVRVDIDRTILDKIIEDKKAK